MKHFIFLTRDGFTETPGNANIENMQVLGFGTGENEESAFSNCIKECKYLENAGYSDVVVYELKNENAQYISLENSVLISDLK